MGSTFPGVEANCLRPTIRVSKSTEIIENPAPAAVPVCGRERFLNACHCRPNGRPPVWLMRQAGRALPEYRRLRESHGFLELVQTPELAAEVTMQPVRRFGFDAAILFSDILIAAEGLGQGYRFRDSGGIQMEFAIRSAADVARLESGRVAERLQYVPRAIRLLRAECGAGTALIGFAGSPWTLANFMIEGGSSTGFTRAAALMQSDPKLFAVLMEKITAAVVEVLRLQIDAGVDAVQIFDTLGGLLAGGDFAGGSCRWMKQVVGALGDRAPAVVFAKGAHGHVTALLGTGARVLGVDASVPLAKFRSTLPSNVGVQGNLDPALLLGAPEAVAAETGRILSEMRGSRGHIFNLGHGVPPGAKLECIERLVATVRNFK
jgi:uroporphyrinogen decarboxylase